MCRLFMPDHRSVSYESGVCRSPQCISAQLEAAKVERIYWSFASGGVDTVQPKGIATLGESDPRKCLRHGTRKVSGESGRPIKVGYRSCEAGEVGTA
jgi:hypothetical protein